MTRRQKLRNAVDDNRREKLKNEIDMAIFVKNLDKLDSIWVIQLRQDVDLRLKSDLIILIQRRLVKDFDGDALSCLLVHTFINDGERTTAELAL